MEAGDLRTGVNSDLLIIARRGNGGGKGCQGNGSRGSRGNGGVCPWGLNL